MRLLILLCALLAPTYWLSASAAEPSTLQQLGSRIEQHAVLRADFTQTKHVAALKRPLVTHGELLYSKVHGVVWQIYKPYAISYILSNDSVIEIAADGRRKERSVNDMPGFAQINRIFRAMLAADTTVLNAYFDTKIQNEISADAPWQALLTPKQTQISRFIKAIHVEGSQFVQSIQIEETNKDSTNIVFSNTVAASALSDADIKLFGQAP